MLFVLLEEGDVDNAEYGVGYRTGKAALPNEWQLELKYMGVESATSGIV